MALQLQYNTKMKKKKKKRKKKRRLDRCLSDVFDNGQETLV